MSNPIEIEIRIAIIGEVNSLKKIKKTVSDFPNIKASFINYLYFNNRRQDINTFLHGIEMVLFAEYRLFKEFKDRIKYKIPIHYISPSQSEVYKKLYFLNKDEKDRFFSLDKISLKQDLMELKDHKNIIISKANLSLDEKVEFHIKNHNINKALVLTFFSDVALKLKELSIPNYLINPSKNDIIVGLERALLSAESRKNKESQVLMGIFSVINNNKIMCDKSQIEVERVFNEYAKELDAHISKISNNEFLMISTRGIFEKISKGYKYLPIFNNLKDIKNIVIQVGFGFGHIAAEAGDHAKIALNQATEFGPNSAFIVREDKLVFGPIKDTDYNPYQKYELSIKDPEIIKKAEKANMSASYLVKLMSKASQYQKKDYTSHDLAQTLELTERSANRILLKWSDAKLISIIGEEKVAKQGRPRRLYHFDFLD